MMKTLNFTQIEIEWVKLNLRDGTAEVYYHLLSGDTHISESKRYTLDAGQMNSLKATIQFIVDDIASTHEIADLGTVIVSKAVADAITAKENAK